MSQLPNIKYAVIKIEKIRDYCLSIEHPTGKNKAKVFNRELGLLDTDAEWLRDRIFEGIARSNAIERGSDKYGKRYTVRFRIRNLDKEAKIATGWIIKKDEVIPRMTTCYVDI